MSLLEAALDDVDEKMSSMQLDDYAGFEPGMSPAMAKSVITSGRPRHPLMPSTDVPSATDVLKKSMQTNFGPTIQTWQGFSRSV